jgi:asparagine synthase (glutamine-hydrolysing)
MCGIAGLWQIDKFDESVQTIKHMLACLKHRGPDDEGVWQDGAHGVTLGQRRLAIIDLSPGGHQPMLSDDGRLAITFNGEIYNYLDLRSDLEAHGIRFRSHSDTEVLLKGYEYWGTKVLDKLVGMFAFALWDAEQEQLFLARDRAGEKPLYYLQTDQGFAFSSELQALKYVPGFSPTIRQESVALYLMLCNVPAPYTIFENVFKLPPAHAMLVSKKTSNIWRYWDPLAIAQEARLTISDDEAEQQLEHLLRQAVKGQMISDVPLGAFLSGGIDSSTVVSFMAELSSQKVKTFTIGFDSPIDEAPHAAAIAKHLGTDHTAEYMTEKEVLETLPLIPGMFGEPFADPTALANYLVAKIARKHVTVCISGDGGDESFGGYTSWHTNYERIKRFYLNTPVLSVLRPVAAMLPKRYGRAGMLIGRPLPETFLSFMSFYLADEIEAMTGLKPSYPAYEQTWSSNLKLSDHRRGLTATLLTYLPDFILTKVDRSAMAVSLESRAPILDHRVLEFSLRLPEHYVKEKRLLKNVLYRRVPKALLDRPKQGFALLPLEKWLQGELREPLQEALTERRLAKVGVRASYAQKLLREHITGTRNHQRRLWALWVLSSWAEEYTQLSS